MTKASLNAVSLGNILKKIVKSFNAGHLAHASKQVVPENKLVKYLNTELLQNPKIQVKKHFSHDYEKFGDVYFLFQPGIDLIVQYDGYLHGVEVKLATEKNNFVFYRGIDEAIAHSVYGVDFGWIIHFYPTWYWNNCSYQKWMTYIIKQSKCPCIGYIAATSNSCNLYVCPTKPFSRSIQIDKDLREAVLHVRKDLNERLKSS